MTIPERIGVALGVSALMVVAFALGANAAVVDSDSEAQMAFLAEYDADRAGVVDAFNLYLTATSGPEKLDSLLALEGAIEATIEHLQSLEDGRECYALSRTVAVMEFIELAAVIRQIRTGEGEPDYARVNAAHTLMTLPGFHLALNDCTEANLA